MVQCKSAHAGELHAGGQVACLVFVSQTDQVFHLFRGVERLPVLPEPVLGDIFQRRCGHAVHHAAFRHAASGVDGFDGRPGQSLLRTEQGTGLELARVGHDKVAGREIGHILIHIKATGKVHRHGQQHHRQGQRKHRHRGFTLAAAQVGPGHGERVHLSGLPALGAGFSAAFGVAHRFYRGDLCGHPARLTAGDKYCKQGK